MYIKYIYIYSHIYIYICICIYIDIYIYINVYYICLENGEEAGEINKSPDTL